MVGEENPEQFLFPSIEVAERRTTTTTPRETNILVKKNVGSNLVSNDIV